MEYIDRLRKIIKEIDNTIAIKGIDEKTNLITDFGFDSITIIHLVLEIEDEFQIDINTEDLILDNLADISKLLQLIHKMSDLK